MASLLLNFGPRRRPVSAVSVVQAKPLLLHQLLPLRLFRSKLVVHGRVATLASLGLPSRPTAPVLATSALRRLDKATSDPLSTRLSPSFRLVVSALSRTVSRTLLLWVLPMLVMMTLPHLLCLLRWTFLASPTPVLPAVQFLLLPSVKRKKMKDPRRNTLAFPLLPLNVVAPLLHLLALLSVSLCPLLVAHL
jgi:hypothetical protein